jgi:hypothetical protein
MDLESFAIIADVSEGAFNFTAPNLTLLKCRLALNYLVLTRDSIAFRTLGAIAISLLK